MVVTGGAGFLGSHFCERLLDRGHDVIAVDNLVSGAIGNIEHLFGAAGLHLCPPRRVVLHLDPGPSRRRAAPGQPSISRRLREDPDPDPQGGQPRHAQHARFGTRKGAKFQLNSTSEVYGDPLVHPQTEDYWGHVNPIGPRGVYDEAKRFAEAMTMAYHRAHDLDVRIVRTFNTYGPRMRPDDGRSVTNFVVQALRGEPLTLYGDGSQTRSFCYVDDQIEGQLALFDSSYVGPMNIGNPVEFTVAQLAEMTLELTGSASPIERRPLPVDDPTQRRPDISLARKVTGWEPKVDLREGLSRTIDWFRWHLAR